MDRRQWLATAGTLWTALRPVAAADTGMAAASAAVPLGVPAPLARLHTDRLGTLLAVTRAGELLQADATGWRRLGSGLDPAAPVATGHGRVVGRSAAGGLWVLEAGRMSVAHRPLLAPHAGLLVLAFGIIAIAASSDGVFRVVRLDPDGGSWAEAARHPNAVLPDARPLQFDPRGDLSDPGADDDGHVLVFGAPSDSRYRHGALGDAIEPTALMLLERHGLTLMVRIDLPAPYVFEDIAPRPIAWRGGRAVLTVRSGPSGAQLCVVAPTGEAGRFQLAALGEPIGSPNRWLSPSTDGQRLLAVVTPHIGGVLHRHDAQGVHLPSQVIAHGLSNHMFGQRELDVSAWVGPRWVVPSQDRQRLLVIDLDAALPVASPESIALAAPVLGLKAWRRGPQAGVVALLQDGSAWWVRVGP